MVSATAEPDTLAKMRLENTPVCPNPPRKCPMSDCAKLMRRLVRPPWFINSPANTNKGIANKEKLSAALAARCAKIRIGTSVAITMASTARPIENAMGTPIVRNTKSNTSMKAASISISSGLALTRQSTLDARHILYQHEGGANWHSCIYPRLRYAQTRCNLGVCHFHQYHAAVQQGAKQHHHG